MIKDFDGLEYTRDSLAIQLLLTENHSSDGSATEAGCACIQERHLLAIEGYSNEGVALGKDKKEKEFYAWLSTFARDLRKQILEGNYSIPGNVSGSGCAPCKPCNCSEPVNDEAED